MAKTVEQLEAALAKAREQEAAATGGLEESQEAFTMHLDGIVEGTPEQLIALQSTFKDFVAAIKANWRYRGRPVMTEEQRNKAVEATKRSNEKRAAREAVEAGTATPEQVALASGEAAKPGRKAKA